MKFLIFKTLLLLVGVASADPGASALCPKWLPVDKVGEIDSKIVDESSGLARSKKYERLYHINDSSQGPEFYYSNVDGSKLTRVQVSNFTPRDPEEIGLSVCPHNVSATCIVIADIGDNLSRRKSVALFFIEERSDFPASVSASFIARFTYPGGPHNAEAMTVLDNGDVVILTKDMSMLGKASVSQVFRAKKSSYLSAKGNPIPLEKIGEIDVASLLKKNGYSVLVTAMSSIGSGQRFAILTYDGAIEFSVDLAAAKFPVTAELKEGRDYRIIPLTTLPQQESLTYDLNQRDLLYSTEVMQRLLGFGNPAPLNRIRCAL